MKTIKLVNGKEIKIVLPNNSEFILSNNNGCLVVNAGTIFNAIKYNAMPDGLHIIEVKNG